MIFGTLNLEKISDENLTHLSTSLVRCSHFTLGNPKKVIFSSIIHTYLWLFTLPQKKTNCNPLAHPPENVTTVTCEMQNFFIWLFVAFFQTLEALKRATIVGCHWWLWKEPAVMCGNWNVRQAMSQQVFRVTTFCINTCFQSFSTLISRVVHHAVLKFSPRRNKLLPQASTRPYQYTQLLL